VELKGLGFHFVNREATDVSSMMLKYCKIEAVNTESVHYMGNSQEHIFYTCGRRHSTVGFKQ